MASFLIEINNRLAYLVNFFNRGYGNYFRNSGIVAINIRLVLDAWVQGYMGVGCWLLVVGGWLLVRKLWGGREGLALTAAVTEHHRNIGASEHLRSTESLSLLTTSN